MAVLLAFLILIAGTAGLMYLEDLSLIDALYMVVITLSTVGFGEVKQLAESSRIFVMVLIVFGVGLGGYIATVIGQFVLEGQFGEIVARRKMDKYVKNLQRHFIVAGYGRVGRQVVQEFQKKKKVPYVVIEKDTEAIQKLTEDGIPFIVGDAVDEDILRRANIDGAHTLISTLPEEAHNVYLTLTARDMNPKLKIIARADFEDGERKLIRAGANYVVIPHVIGGLRMAMASLQPHVVDFMQLASFGEEGLSLEELVIPANSRLCGHSLLESGLKKDYGVTIIGIKHPEKKMTLNPGPGEKLGEGDILVLIGQTDKLRDLNKDLGI